MRNFTLWLSGACMIASVLLSGCHTGKQASQSKTVVHKNIHSPKPKFMEGVTVGGNNKSSSISMNVVDKHHHHKESKKAADQAKVITAEPTQAPAPVMINTEPRDASMLALKYGGMLGVMPQTITNFPLYGFIDEWYGVDYRLGGSDKSGIDCSAFVQRLYEQVFGTTLLRTAIEQFHNCDMTKNMNKVKEGDLVFFHIHSKHITHVGIYLANRFFVHASASQGVVISSLDDEYWHKYFAGAGRLSRK